MLRVVAALAGFGRQLVREPVTAELRNAETKGRVLGRPLITVDARTVAIACFRITAIASDSAVSL